jgi:hypothetical protein
MLISGRLQQNSQRDRDRNTAAAGVYGIARTFILAEILLLLIRQPRRQSLASRQVVDLDAVRCCDVHLGNTRNTEQGGGRKKEQEPKMWEDVPEMWEGVPEMWEDVPEMWEDVPEMWEDAPEMWEDVPEMWESNLWEDVPEMWEDVPKMWEGVPEMWEDVPEMWEEQFVGRRKAMASSQQAYASRIGCLLARAGATTATAPASPLPPLVVAVAAAVVIERATSTCHHQSPNTLAHLHLQPPPLPPPTKHLTSNKALCVAFASMFLNNH